MNKLRIKWLNWRLKRREILRDEALKDWAEWGTKTEECQVLRDFHMAAKYQHWAYAASLSYHKHERAILKIKTKLGDYALW